MNRNVVATAASHNEYEDVLLNNKCLRHSMNRIKSKDHGIGTYEINKISLSCFDDKTCIQNNGDDSWLSRLIRKNTYLNNYFKKSFFVKHIVLIFSLIFSFYSVYKNIVRLLVWHIKLKKRKALKKRVKRRINACCVVS